MRDHIINDRTQRILGKLRGCIVVQGGPEKILLKQLNDIY